MNKTEVCELLDILTLEMFELMEQRIQCMMNLEKRINEGKLLLAKARYINGTQTVTEHKLPTENSPDFKALCQVVATEENEGGKYWNKHWILKIFDVNKVTGYLDPLRWFGILPPRCLQLSKDKFKSSVDYAVEYANIQNELNSVMCYIHKLRNFKNSL